MIAFLSSNLANNNTSLPITFYPQSIDVPETPAAVFKVNPNKRYRFRFINAASHVCPVQIQVSQQPYVFSPSDLHLFDVCIKYYLQ